MATIGSAWLDGVWVYATWGVNVWDPNKPPQLPTPVSRIQIIPLEDRIQKTAPDK